ncbi:Multifunctional cyclase-dehydratase-3-O-methyl transferase TcmN [Roseovarius sp. THAF9]|uniref:methyltransferase n=1 Tax=Roseovarius sp. THAF9 TaxID=2587847 RepID=UPI0012AA575C|nr:methyltransferase [Roseovarius sp. THAF9]QFT93839.1 Multifunctional cyclase-dehydratase-3-O-methyl transferase TcmN [Roseovarius sp. THAF9]
MGFELEHSSDVWDFFSNLKEHVTTDERDNKSDYFDALNEGQRMGFLKTMHAQMVRLLPDLLPHIDLSTSETIVDAGAGSGALIAALAAKHPEKKFQILETPDMVATARKAGLISGLAENVSIYSGDFFESQDVSADLCILSKVLHDWSDGEVVKLLQALQERVTQVLIFEEMMIERTSPSVELAALNLFLSLKMGRGRLRDVAEYSRLLSQAGFHLDSFKPVGNTHILVAARR